MALRPTVAASIVFVASGAVLVLEILGVRLLAPYVGLTLETTTAIIGTVLGGIAAGAALGGRAADRMPGRPLLAGLLVAGGLLALTSVPLVRALGPAARGGGDAAALLVTAVALLPAAAALSAVTPVVVRMQLASLQQAGTVVGRLSAWATAGALAGTFSAGFVVVPLLPTTASVLAVGVALVVLGAAVGGLGARASAVALVVGAALAAGTALAGTPCDAETTYHCADVRADPQRPGGRTLVLDDLRHSYVDLRDPTHLEFPYVRWIAGAVDGLRPGPLDAVFVGGGGFTLPRWLAATRPGSRSTVFEVDGGVVNVARERLGLRSDDRLRVEVADARVAVADVRDASADLVVGDAFGQLSVPWPLTTREWHAEVRRVLRDDGLYALNLIDHGDLRLARALAATLLDGFADVRLVVEDDRRGNFVLLAGERPLLRTVTVDGDTVRTLDRAGVEAFAGNADALTDDDAPADQLLDPR